MNAVMDVMVALFISGMLIFTAMNMDSNTRTHLIVSDQDLTAQENMRVLTDIIENDFRKIGYGLSRPQDAITLAGESRIIFSYDENPGSAFDSIRVEYSVRRATATANPDDEILVRSVNGRTENGGALGMTQFTLRYFNQYGTELATPVVADSLSKIRAIELTMVVQSPERFHNRTAVSKYVTWFTPKNLLIRYGK